MASALLLSVSAASALTITGTVSNKKYLLSGSPIKVSSAGILKISFQTTTAGNNLALCAGSLTDFNAGVCTTSLNDSGGPGFTFLTIVDPNTLNGKYLYVIQDVGTNPAGFTVTVE